MIYLKDFSTQICNRDYSGFLRLWDEYCEGQETDPFELLEILKKAKESEFANSFGRHVEKILTCWELLPASTEKNTIFKLIIDIQTTNNDLLRQMTFDHLRQVYGQTPNYGEKIHYLELRSKESFQGIISDFQLLNHMVKGNIVLHKRGWGAGEILEVSFIREQLVLEFENTPSKKDISFTNAFSTLVPLDSEHFLSLRFGNPDLLEKRAKENPAEVFRLLLRDLGPKNAADVRDELCELVIPEKDWAAWWQKARAKIKKDPFIFSPDNLKDPFYLQTEAVSSEQKFEQLLKGVLTASGIIEAVSDFIKDFPETLKNKPFKSQIQTHLKKAREHMHPSEAESLEIYFLMDTLGSDDANAQINQAITEAKSVENLVQECKITSLKKQILSECRTSRPDWEKIFLNILFTTDQSTLREYLFTELEQSDSSEELKKRFGELSIHPTKNVDLFLWYFQKTIVHQTLVITEQDEKNKLFEGLFILLSQIENTPSHKDTVKKIHTLLSAKKYLLVREMMQKADINAVKEFLLLTTKCRSITDHDVKIFHSLAEVEHPSLTKLHKKSEASEESEVIWTTEEGYERVKKRIEHIGTVETVAISREIELARSHGDLRENMEFKAALRKRDDLQNELKTLSNLLNKAQIFTRDDVTTNKVGLGTVVTYENNAGKQLSYAILGVLDANIDKHILSIQSKLGQTLKNLKAGEEFHFQGEKYKLVSITNYFDKN